MVIDSLQFHCQQVSKTYLSHREGTVALRDVSFSMKAGEFVCLVGPSGCGKTTLLKIIGDLVKPDEGSVALSGALPGGMPPSALVFQDHALFPWMKVIDNVAFGLETQGVPREDRRARAAEFLGLMGLSGFAYHYPNELSIGMRQRAAIARAFLRNPAMLLMDEPFSALDAQTKIILQEELLRIWRDHKKMVVYVTHDIEEAVLLGTRILVMSGRPGQIQMDIPVPIQHPRNLRDRNLPEVREITWQIWQMIEAEVRQNLKSSELPA